MIEVITESGAIYHLDTDNGYAKRLSGPEVQTRTWDDGVWEQRTLLTDLVVGQPMLLVSEGRFRNTTPVVSFLDI